MEKNQFVLNGATVEVPANYADFVRLVDNGSPKKWLESVQYAYEKLPNPIPAIVKMMEFKNSNPGIQLTSPMLLIAEAYQYGAEEFLDEILSTASLRYKGDYHFDKLNVLKSAFRENLPHAIPEMLNMSNSAETMRFVMNVYKDNCESFLPVVRKVSNHIEMGYVLEACKIGDQRLIDRLSERIESKKYILQSYKECPKEHLENLLSVKSSYGMMLFLNVLRLKNENAIKTVLKVKDDAQKMEFVLNSYKNGKGDKIDELLSFFNRNEIGDIYFMEKALEYKEEPNVVDFIKRLYKTDNKSILLVANNEYKNQESVVRLLRDSGTLLKNEEFRNYILDNLESCDACAKITKAYINKMQEKLPIILKFKNEPRKMDIVYDVLQKEPKALANVLMVSDDAEKMKLVKSLYDKRFPNRDIEVIMENKDDVKLMKSIASEIVEYRKMKAKEKSSVQKEKKEEEKWEKFESLIKNKNATTISEYLKNKEVTRHTDAAEGDIVCFTEAVFSGSFKNATFEGERNILAYVEKENYGGLKGQHTFTLRVIESAGESAYDKGELIFRKGRTMYKNDFSMLPLAKQELRDAKHSRGLEAKESKYWSWLREAEFEGKMFKMDSVPKSFLESNMSMIESSFPVVYSKYGFEVKEVKETNAETKVAPESHLEKQTKLESDEGLKIQKKPKISRRL